MDHNTSGSSGSIFHIQDKPSGEMNVSKVRIDLYPKIIIDHDVNLALS
jgi:hypothetical protein